MCRRRSLIVVTLDAWLGRGGGSSRSTGGVRIFDPPFGLEPARDKRNVFELVDGDLDVVVCTALAKVKG